MSAARERLPWLLLAALFVGYAASYFHRADLPTLAPLLATDAQRSALHAALPDIASAGMLLYALGKVLGGWLADRFGGRRLFVLALLNAAAMEAIAAQCTAPLPFALCRLCGMVVLGAAWPSLGKVVAATTAPARLGVVLAWLSQSYLLGDAAVRTVLAAVVADGGGVPDVLRTSAVGLGVVALFVGIVLFVQRPIAGATACGHVASTGRSGGVPRLLLALAAMNAALSGVREALSLWSPQVLVDIAGMPVDDAVRASALLPLGSCFAVLLLTPLAERSPRALFLVVFGPPVLAASLLGVLASGACASSNAVIAMLAAAGGCLAVPMVLASGVLPLRAGATGGGALRLGLVDGAGSLGGVLAGSVFGRVVLANGPSGLFLGLALLAATAAAFAVVVTRAQSRAAADRVDR
ncbi:MAG: MFS transporter [Planctomycetes bacterium]|nr:MFS transporter [Planctomycetota bacterium]